MASMIDHRDAHYVKTLNDVTDHMGVCGGGGGRGDPDGRRGGGWAGDLCLCMPAHNVQHFLAFLS